VDFHAAYNQVVAELTPQPWDYTSVDGATLTVIPAGLPDNPGMAEVLIRITTPGADPIEAGITTTDLPAVIDTLASNKLCSDGTMTDMWYRLSPSGGGGMMLTLEEGPDAEEAAAQIHVPEAQRMPFASALRRALDVARGWES
jgi:hypothetical protein